MYVMYRAKLTNVVSKFCKKVKVKILEAIVEHNSHVSEPRVHI